MTGWLVRHRAKLEFGLRMTLAALLSYAIAEALGLAQSYWAVLSAVIVMQGSVGGSLKAGGNRLIGTVGGAIWGSLVSIVIPHRNPATLAAALVAATAPLGVVTGFRPDYRIAPITAIIVLMSTAASRADPAAAALSRVFEISLGSAVAIAVALFILPARAQRLLALSASAAVSAMADMASILRASAGAGVDEQSLAKVGERLRAAIAQAEARAAEANVERSNRLSGGPDPEPLARTLRRLRHDLAMLARALGAPFSEPVRERVEAPLVGLFGSFSGWLALAANALMAGQSAPPLSAVHAAAEAYKAAVGGKQDALPYEAGSEDSRRLFALLFLFEQILNNLQDLADRVTELADTQTAKPQHSARTN